MTLALRRTVFADGERPPDDYEVHDAGRTVGRIYRMNSTGRELWRWTQIGIRAPSHDPNGGAADTLDERSVRRGTSTAHLKGRVAALPVRMTSFTSGLGGARRDMLGLSVSDDDAGNT